MFKISSCLPHVVILEYPQNDFYQILWPSYHSLLVQNWAAYANSSETRKKIKAICKARLVFSTSGSWPCYDIYFCLGLLFDISCTSVPRTEKLSPCFPLIWPSPWSFGLKIKIIKTYMIALFEIFFGNFHIQVVLFCKPCHVMTHKCRGSIAVLSINKSVEPKEEQKVLACRFAQRFHCKY